MASTNIFTSNPYQTTPLPKSYPSTTSANPSASSPNLSTPAAQTYVQNQYKIQSGDTLGGIAAKNNTTIQNLLSLNPTVTDPNKIYAGQSINLSGTPSSTNTSTNAPSPTPAPNNSQQQFIQNQIADKQAQVSALQNNNFSDTNQLKQDASGNYVPSDFEAAKKDYTTEYDDYIKLLNPTAEQTGAQQKLNDFTASENTALQNISDQTIPMRFITGQQKSLESRAEIEANRLKGNVDIANTNATQRQNAGLANVSLKEKLLGMQKSPEDKATVALAKTKAQNDIYGTGIVGEYQFAKDNGYKGTFTQYQNEDANRKLVATGNKSSTTTTPANNNQSQYIGTLATQGRQAITNLKTIADGNKNIFGASAAIPIPDYLRSDPYRNYKAQLEYLKGNIIPAALTAMRDASKTGGALGQVSDKESSFLSASLGALDMTQSYDQIVNQLNQIDESLQRWQSAVDTYSPSSNNTINNDPLGIR